MRNQAAQSPTNLERAIFNTIRYYDLFALPVTATQIWQCLVIAGVSLPEHPALAEVEDTARTSFWLAERTCTQWGYWALAGKQYAITERLQRHVLAQDKWKITQKVLRKLAWVPFVRAMAGSGSLAMDNTGPDSDLDMFVIVRSGRIWTTRLLLLLALQLLGRRRKYWNQKAPDKMCLNHYITDSDLSIHPDIRNIYTAVQYATFVPVAGRRVISQFQQANSAWMRQYVSVPEMPDAVHAYNVRTPRWLQVVKRQVELLLLEPVGDGIESLARRLQLYVIRRHHESGQPGRIALSARELAFHPDTKIPALVQQFQQSTT